MYAKPLKFLELLNAQVQYVVPRWQRRYCWNSTDIERLVEDLITIAAADPGATHYGGTLLTFPEPGPAGVVTTIRVVDGQQRLTTVSILLASIADELGSEGNCDGWTREIIRNDRLTNPGKPLDKRRKLRLQDGDEEEYLRGLESVPEGEGAVTQAWRIARRLVARNGVGLLLKGLDRLHVVSIGLDDKEDPQQIFESLNATGRSLAESEKVKNWLLMGLPDAVQQDLYDNHWLQIEKRLDARHAGERIDMFLRDVLRWKTGQIHGIDRVYEGVRRWAVQSGRQGDRPALCRDLAHLAGLYGMLTGTAKGYGDAKVDRELRHLRELGIDVHRPLTLRLLNDANDNNCAGGGDAELVKSLAGIGAWTTRMWLAGRPTAGMNRTIAELAHEAGPDGSADFSEHWLGRIRRLRNTRVGVPSDGDVREGVRTRQAYGGSTTGSARAVLCELMEAKHREEAPARDHLTIEHVMPQKLTDEWKRYLGDDAEEVHGQYRDRLANLTLSGDATNAGMGANTFDAKKEVYRNSSIGMTRLIAEESEWNEAALEQRAEDLADLALVRWPWTDPLRRREDAVRSTRLRWRIEDGPWRHEDAASQMVSNVAAGLLDRDPENGKRLSGEAIRPNIHPASQYPSGRTVGTLTMRTVPGHDAYVLYPYEQNNDGSAERCRKMGRRCGVTVEVEFAKDNTYQEFWKLLKEQVGGVPGQKDTWSGPTQWSVREGEAVDRVGIHIGNQKLLWLYIKSGEFNPSEERAARMRHYSRKIRERMGDQQLGGNLNQNSAKGWSISVQRPWMHDDVGEWLDAAQWISDQCDRLHAIVGEVLGDVS